MAAPDKTRGRLGVAKPMQDHTSSQGTSRNQGSSRPFRNRALQIPKILREQQDIPAIPISVLCRPIQLEANSSSASSRKLREFAPAAALQYEVPRCLSVTYGRQHHGANRRSYLGADDGYLPREIAHSPLTVVPDGYTDAAWRPQWLPRA